MITVAAASLIKSTLSATTTHLAISLGLPPWMHKALEKIMKGFLWSGTDSVQGEMSSGVGRCSKAVGTWRSQNFGH
jgi:hypothetical protein